MIELKTKSYPYPQKVRFFSENILSIFYHRPELYFSKFKKYLLHPHVLRK